MEYYYHYLANPYQGTEEERHYRAEMTAKVCISLLRKGIPVLSPIVHNHALIQSLGPFTLEERRQIFLTFDFNLLKHARSMIVLTLDGWKTSYGVQAEIEFCSKQQIPVLYEDPERLLLDTIPEEFLFKLSEVP